MFEGSLYKLDRGHLRNGGASHRVVVTGQLDHLRSRVADGQLVFGVIVRSRAGAVISRGFAVLPDARALEVFAVIERVRGRGLGLDLDLLSSYHSTRSSTGTCIWTAPKYGRNLVYNLDTGSVLRTASKLPSLFAPSKTNRFL
jgi:hypothetical protein